MAKAKKMVSAVQKDTPIKATSRWYPNFSLDGPAAKVLKNTPIGKSVSLLIHAKVKSARENDDGSRSFGVEVRGVKNVGKKTGYGKGVSF